MATITDKELEQKLAKFTDLPSLPQNIIKIKQISENPKASAADLANCILSDHQLTSRVLRMANSVYYASYSGKISTITHAIVLMGFRAIHNISISMSVYEVINKLTREVKFDIIAFWLRSMACGIIAKFLASKINQKNLIEAAFIAGFMHDIGQPILAGAFPEKYKEIINMKTTVQNSHKIEQIIIGVNHMKAGEHVAKKWNLPLDLIKVVTEHHRVNKEPNAKSSSVLIDMVYLADNLYNHVMGKTSPLSDEYSELINQACSLIGISEENMVELLIECRRQVDDIAKEMEIDIELELAKLDIPEFEESDIRKQLNYKEMQLSFMQNATDALMEAKSNDEVLQIICEAIFRGLQMGRVLLLEYDAKWESFTGQIGFGVESQEFVHALGFSVKNGIFRHLYNNGKALLIDGKNSKDYEYLVTEDEAQRLELQAFAIIPIKILDKPKYAIFIDAPNRETPIDIEAFRSMISLSNQATLTLERNLFKEKIKQ